MKDDIWIKECPFRFGLADARCIRERCWAYRSMNNKHYNGHMAKGVVTYKCAAFGVALGKETYEESK